MRYYETLYIAHPDYEDARLDELKNNVDELFRNLSAEIVYSYTWGKRRLAYEVNKSRYGTYMMLQYSVQEPFIGELNSWMELQEPILAYLTTRLDDAPVIKKDSNGEASFDEKVVEVEKTKEAEG